jgi:TetR/AcrR family transcriptional repressor of nem operon
VALASEVRQEDQVGGPFTEQLKSAIQKLATRFPWRSRPSAQGDAIHLCSAMIGAVILARAVNDKNFSRKILAEARKRIR